MKAVMPKLPVLHLCALCTLGLVAQGFTPKWDAPSPDPSKPLAGYTQVPGAVHTEVYHAIPSFGTYNHAVMMGFYNGSLVVTFKNGVESEDRPGQRVLYTVTQDGKKWSATQTDGAILFPNVSTSSNPAHLFAEPPIVLNGRWYAAASPKQFCLFPDQYQPLLLLRQMDFSRCNGVDQPADDPCTPELGTMFWASTSVPAGFEAASRALGIRTVPEMDARTQADMRTLADPDVLPCESTFPATAAGKTTKCEAAVGGLQNWSLPLSMDLANERTHYVAPADAAVDVLLYRSRKQQLYSSYRNFTAGGIAHWSTPEPTDIPDKDSNINTGRLFDGRVYLVSNCNKDGPMRDPLTIATSKDGASFDRVSVVVSCTELGPDDSRCKERFAGSAKSPGAQYPQAIDIRDWSASGGQDGTYVAYSLNKEDIWVTRLPVGSIPN